MKGRLESDWFFFNVIRNKKILGFFCCRCNMRMGIEKIVKIKVVSEKKMIIITF